jgi:hypothetical protein
MRQLCVIMRHLKCVVMRHLSALMEMIAFEIQRCASNYKNMHKFGRSSKLFVFAAKILFLVTVTLDLQP